MATLWVAPSPPFLRFAGPTTPGTRSPWAAAQVVGRPVPAFLVGSTTGLVLLCIYMPFGVAGRVEQAVLHVLSLQVALSAFVMC